jgi:hypothetical protein
MSGCQAGAFRWVFIGLGLIFGTLSGSLPFRWPPQLDFHHGGYCQALNPVLMVAAIAPDDGLENGWLVRH